LVLTAASWAGLVGLDRIAARADGVLEAALVDGLGPDYRSRMAAAFAPPEDVPIARREVANPLPPLRRRYATTRDVPYGEFGRRNHLDIWRRFDLPDDAGAPVLIQVHGGAWMTGSKEQQGAPLMGHLAERGWVSVALNYRLSPRSTWPDQIVDVKRAITWVKAHIAEYGGDPDFVVITGGSAGGHLSALAALTPGVGAFQPGFEDADTSVQAAVPMYGVYDFTNRDHTGRVDMEEMLSRLVFKSTLADAREVWEQASPMSWVGPDAPPFFIAHGANDSLVPVEQARSFARMLREASDQPVVYAELPRAQHGFDLFSSVRTLHTMRAVDRFLAVVRTAQGARAVPTDAAEPAPPSSS
jgi:acetyl esterase/lipase